MPRPSGCLKRALLVLPWLVVAALALELGAIGIPLLKERNNPYYKAWQGERPWPDTDSGSELVGQMPKANPARLPQPTLELELAAHAVFLLRADKPELLDYSATYARTIAIYRDLSNLAPEVFSDEGFPKVDTHNDAAWIATLAAKPLSDIPGSAWKEWAYQAEVIPLQEGPRTSRAMVCLTRKDRSEKYAVSFMQWPEPYPPEDSPYDFAFLNFKKHGERLDYWGMPEFRLNNYGFRDDDVQVPRPADVFRVACVGASTTYEGPTNGFTYPNLVEHFLGEAFPGRRIEVINCGVSGLETRQEQARFADYVMLDPNVIVYYNAVNDITHTHQPVWYMNDPLIMASRFSRFMVLAFDALLPPGRARMRRDMQDVSIHRLERMAFQAQQQGVTFVWCTFSHPDGPNLTGDELTYFRRDARVNWTGRPYTLETYLRAIAIWNNIVREKTSALGIPLIDVAAQLTGGGRVFGDICHMKDYGIEQKARIIAKGLEPMVRQYFEKSSAILPPAEPGATP